MKLLLSMLIYGVLISAPCMAQTLPAGKNEVVIESSFNKYAWTLYASDGQIFDRSMLVTLDEYNVAYRLTPDSLLIWKRPHDDRRKPSVIHKQALGPTDHQLVVQLLAATKLETLGKTPADEDLPDHGLYATVFLGRQSIEFQIYKEPTMQALLNIIDRLAPAAYKFSEPLRSPCE